MKKILIILLIAGMILGSSTAVMAADPVISDVTGPTITDAKCDKQGQTLSPGDTVKFSFKATDESGLQGGVSVNFFEATMYKGRSFNWVHNEATGVFETTYTIPEGVQNGEYYISTIYMYDIYGNQTSYSTHLGYYVTGGISDVTGPTITDAKCDKQGQTLSPGDTVKFSFKATDESGLQGGVSVNFFEATMYKGRSFNWVHDEATGVFETTYTIPEGVQVGEYYISTIYMYDIYGNQTSYSTHLGYFVAETIISSLTNGDTNSGITINWTAPSTYSKFRIQRKAGSGSWTTITSSASGGSYTDSKATVGGTPYAYRISGYHDGTWTDYSESVSLIRNPFTDVKTSASYFKALCWAYNNGIVAGTSTTKFSPNDNCTRGQFALMLWRMNGKPSTVGLENPFTDVKSSNGFYNGIVWCYNKGITAGTSATTFSPNNNITRWQMILMFWRMQDKPKSSLTENPFTDVKTTASYYKAALWAYEKKITAVEKFMPNDLCTRWQLVLFLYRLNNLYHYI